MMSEYHKKMEELGMCKARDDWCMQVEQQLSCSMEHRKDDAPSEMHRVHKQMSDMVPVQGENGGQQRWMMRRVLAERN